MNKATLELFAKQLDEIREAGTYKDERIITTPQSAIIDTTKARREKNLNPRPYWEAVHCANKDSQHIVIEDELQTIGHVRFYALKDKKATDKILYMRRPLMLVKA